MDISGRRVSGRLKCEGSDWCYYAGISERLFFSVGVEMNQLYPNPKLHTQISVFVTPTMADVKTEQKRKTRIPCQFLVI